MRKLQLVMPMAGEGSRFVKQGWNTPKPLIEVDGLKLFERAINSIRFDQVDINHTFIIRKEHSVKFGLDDILKEKFPDATILSIEKTTRGATETCFLAVKNYSPDDALLILDCDLEFRSPAFCQAVEKSIVAESPTIDGALVSFRANSPRYSYAKTDDNDNVTETAEKIVISGNALCGSYYFAKIEDFLQVAQTLLNNPEYQNKELYISLLFNELLKFGKKVRLFRVEQYQSFGTPEEINDYYANVK